jgi:hypothetical protein
MTRAKAIAIPAAVSVEDVLGGIALGLLVLIVTSVGVM